MAKLYGEISSSKLMTFEKSFARALGQPLDFTEVYYNKTKAEKYAASAAAYVGQKIVVVENGIVSHYSIEDTEGNLRKLDSTPIGDNSSITVAKDGTISLKNIDSLVFEQDILDEENNPTGEKREVQFQPLMTKNGLVWLEPNKTTVEGLVTLVDALENRINSIEVTLSERIDIISNNTAINKNNIDNITMFLNEQVKIINSHSDKIIELENTNSNIQNEHKTLLDIVNSYDITITNNTKDIAVLKADETVEGSVLNIVKKETTEAINNIINDAPEVFDTLKEIADWINDDITGTAALTKRVTENTILLETITDIETGILAQAVNTVATKESLGTVKYDDRTIGMNSDNQLYVKKVTTDILTEGSKTLFINGGSANF